MQHYLLAVISLVLIFLQLRAVRKKEIELFYPHLVSWIALVYNLLKIVGVEGGAVGGLAMIFGLIISNQLYSHVVGLRAAEKLPEATQDLSDAIKELPFKGMINFAIDDYSSFYTWWNALMVNRALGNTEAAFKFVRQFLSGEKGEAAIRQIAGPGVRYNVGEERESIAFSSSEGEIVIFAIDDKTVRYLWDIENPHEGTKTFIRSRL